MLSTHASPDPFFLGSMGIQSYALSANIQNLGASEKETELMQDETEQSAGKKAGFGLVAFIFWCSTGGLMLLHFVTVFFGHTTLIFGAVGLFIPPVGLANGFLYLVTGNVLQDYF